MIMAPIGIIPPTLEHLALAVPFPLASLIALHPPASRLKNCRRSSWGSIFPMAVPHHDNRLPIRNPVLGDMKINEMKCIGVNNPARCRKITVTGPVDVVPTTLPRAGGSLQLVTEFVGAIVGRNTPIVHSADEVQREHGQIPVRSLARPPSTPTVPGC